MLILKGLPPRRKRRRLYVAEDLSNIVRELARQERRTPSGLLREAVKAWLDNELAPNGAAASNRKGRRR